MSDNVQFVDRAVIAQMMGKLNEEDLIFLNRVIIDRLRLIRQAKNTCLMAQFHVGSRVQFHAADGRHKTGTIVRLNQKTASIETDDGGRWKVSPAFLMAVA